MLTTCCFRSITTMEKTTKPNEAVTKQKTDAAGAVEKNTAEAAENTARAAAEMSRPTPVLTPLTVNGRRVFVLRRGQLQALTPARRVPAERDNGVSATSPRGRHRLLASSKPCFVRRRRPYFGRQPSKSYFGSW
ncbi:hypothetical protein L596_000836 [Steinernema carpocapsae]|uniref:Uncharacterized protein n=1 Tax=Steinernema carpocapsae TaxID=34508 RepID=A0A4U8UJL1_STECR|nr:hypothetical protein L596_000836 [Steinernema carpocapsae]